MDELSQDKLAEINWGLYFLSQDPRILDESKRKAWKIPDNYKQIIEDARDLIRKFQWED